MQIPRVKAEIDRCRNHIVEKAKLEIYDVVVDIKKVLSSDGRELIQYVRGACRYCHGDSHLYQRRPSEDAEALRLGNYDPMGGVGYDSRREPHPDCPECDGEGEMRTVAMDTRYLSPEGVAMYDGVKPTRNGIEVKMRSRDAARAAAAQYLGMNKLDLTLKDGRKATELSDDELAALVTAK